MPDHATMQTPGAKMMYLIRRRPEATREEVLAHWFANHMPLVIERQLNPRGGMQGARRYTATLFDAQRDGSHPWDGVAQLWFDEPLPMPKRPHGTRPADSFQEKALPYVPWATREYVVIDGAAQLPVKPLTLNPPFPCTRSGFLKITFLVKTLPGVDHDAFFRHWLEVHAPNVAETAEAAGGFHYLISHSIDAGNEPYAGMAELYFPDVEGWRAYRETIRPDGMERWVDDSGTLVLRAGTEMIGIP